MASDYWQTTVRVQLWACPNDGWPYPDRIWHQIKWDGLRATCLECGETNGE